MVYDLFNPCILQGVSKPVKRPGGDSTMKHDTSKTPSGADKIYRYNWSDPGSPGKFSMIHKDQIVIPTDSYQRAASGGEADRKVIRIASEFSWVAFQIISVVERGGVFYAVDGGHRLRAARRRSDIQMVPCMVYSSDSIKEEAKSFDIVNSNRKPMSAVDRHRAHLIQGDPVAIKAEEYVKEASRTISKHAGSGTISCVNDLKKCIKEDESALSSVWPVVVELCDGQKMLQTVVRGLFYLERFCSEKVSSRRIRSKVLSVGYDEIAQAAKAGAAYYGAGTPRAFADGILKVINRGLHTKVEIDT